MTASGRRRVAILGGGCGAMTAAYYLSRTPELQQQLDITVYQMGWRLGGKGASGRRANMANRIEEHGLHVWGGFYYNAFRMMREAYQRLGRAPGTPLATLDDAFLPRDFVVWEEQLGDGWHHWLLHPGVCDGSPGEGEQHLLPTPAGYLEMTLGWVKSALEDFPHEAVRVAVADAHPLLAEAQQHASASDAGAPPHSGLLGLIERARAHIHDACREYLLDHDGARRVFILTDLAMAAARGIVADGVITQGFTVIDDVDLTDWLRTHGASSMALASAPLRGYYDYFFAYADGDSSQPRMSAAMGLYHLLRLSWDSRGALFYKMASGMGDAVFGPLYDLCRRQGVTFRFFHEVQELIPDADGTRIATIRVHRQVDTKGDYAPMVNVSGLPSWPAEPLLDQVRDDQARRVREEHVDLEDPLSGWTGGVDIELQAGRDFDVVVLGIPVGALPQLCPKLIAQKSEWRDMVENLAAIQTQALQVWFTKPLDQLGWDKGNATGTGYGQPFESWSDMSHVLPREQWNSDAAPQAVVYFCGPMKTPPLPAVGDSDFATAQQRAARETALAWAKQYLTHLFSGAGDANGLQWDVLAAPASSTGEARFDAQYVRANYTPSERYVLDLPGTSKYRLNADASGFSNLLLAGDWVFTGLGGAVESAVVAGMQAAEAASGTSLDIVGALRSPWSRLSKFQR